MLSVGRALAAEPRVLLVEELSLGLAPMLVDRVFEAVQAAASRMYLAAIRETAEK